MKTSRDKEKKLPEQRAFPGPENDLEVVFEEGLSAGDKILVNAPEKMEEVPLWAER